MKIIHIVLGKANPERMNGVNKVAYQLARTQKELGYEVTLWGIANTLDKNYPKRNFDTQLFQQQQNPVKLDSGLIEKIENLTSDTIVHIHGSFIPVFYRIGKLLSQKKIPYIYTPHGSLTEAAMKKNGWAKKIYFQLFESNLIKSAKAIQLLGINEYEFLDKLLITKNKCLIPNGQDLSDIPDFEQAPAKAQYPIFGFCGRLATYHKGLDLTLLGFKQFISRGYIARLELIGDGADRSKLEQLCKTLEVDHLVTFHGAKFGREKFELINQFDCFLHTSRMEGFPTAILEAAALEKVCITSEATNINDYLKKYEAGITLNNNTPEQIADAMVKALKHFSNDELSTIGKRARKMVETEFDWKNIAQQLVEVYSA